MSRDPKKNIGNKSQKPGQVIQSHDLGQKVYQMAGQWATSLYSNIVPEEGLVGFLQSESSGYDADAGRWSDLPQHPTSKAELSASLLKLLNNILDYFYPSFPPGVSRKFVDSGDVPLAHHNSSRTSQADITIQAQGPSFEASKDGGPDGLAYTNAAGVVDVKVGKEWGTHVEQADRLSTNCR